MHGHVNVKLYGTVTQCHIEENPEFFIIPGARIPDLAIFWFYLPYFKLSWLLLLLLEQAKTSDSHKPLAYSRQ